MVSNAVDGNFPPQVFGCTRLYQSASMISPPLAKPLIRVLVLKYLVLK